MRSARNLFALATSAAMVLSLSAVDAASAAVGTSGRGAVLSASADADAPEWSSTTAYNGGDQVTFQGSLWQAGWWTKGQEPGDPNGPWQEIVTTPEGEAVWTPSRSFNAGDVVLHEGIHYVAKWWTRNQLPTDPNGPWRAQQSPGVPGTPTDWSTAYEYSTGDLVRHGGHLWVAMWWAGHQEPGQLDGPWGEVAVTLQGATVWTPTRAFGTGDEVTFQGVEYVAKWWTRNQGPGDPSGPWGLVGDAPAGASLWSSDAVFGASDVVSHRDGQYVATQANRDAEPGDPSGPWVAIPESVSISEPPAIAGKARVGRTVRARAGEWADASIAFRYQWFAGRKPLAHADGRTFAIPAGLRGKLLRVVVTAHRAGAPVGSASSAPVRVKPRRG